VEGDQNLLRLATDYNKNLFGPAPGHNIPMDPFLWNHEEKVSGEDNAWLGRPFTEDEVKHALFQMERNKAAGPDKIPVDFFQSYWDIIKKDIMEIFKDLYDNKLDGSRLNYGVITLLPKIVDANKI
jgi:hypothetical protein